MSAKQKVASDALVAPIVFIGKGRAQGRAHLRLVLLKKEGILCAGAVRSKRVSGYGKEK